MHQMGVPDLVFLDAWLAGRSAYSGNFPVVFPSDSDCFSKSWGGRAFGTVLAGQRQVRGRAEAGQRLAAGERQKRPRQVDGSG